MGLHWIFGGTLKGGVRSVDGSTNKRTRPALLSYTSTGVMKYNSFLTHSVIFKPLKL